MVYLVAFNLRTRSQDYSMFFAGLQTRRRWLNFIDNAWLVETDETSQQLAERLNMYLGDNDYLLVMQVTNDYYGFMPKTAWEWLESVRKEGSLV